MDRRSPPADDQRTSTAEETGEQLYDRVLAALRPDGTADPTPGDRPIQTRPNDGRAGGRWTSTGCDWSGPTDPMTALTVIVSEVTGEDPTDLPPLRDTVDPDALNRLVEQSSDTAGVCVRFEYADCEITLTGDGRIDVSECFSGANELPGGRR